ncbi:glycosyltransferase [Microbispora sp. NPDC046933]|uniref:glycosyltransferase n=1 Tax=Microbispora sp. NPDC046933 TaxID=3155618 RepID=UPI0033E1BD71
MIGADTYPPDINGAANFAHRLATGLAGRGHEVHVICPSPGGGDERVTSGGPAVHRLASHGTPFHPDFRVCLPWQIRGATARLLDRIAPDVVHIQSHFAVGRTLITAAQRRGVPVVATNHFMPENLVRYTRLPGRLADAACGLLWRDFVRVFRRADIVTAPTPRAVQLMHRHGLVGTALAVSCGLDLRRFAQPAAKKEDQGLRVLFVGRLDAEKNVHELLRALALLPAVTAEIVGHGSRRGELEELACTLGVADRVTFHGLVGDQELLDAYARCDVFCMPSTAELQSLATMEAMAAGKPVVAADAMALPHLVHPGRNGELFPPGDIAALAVALGSVLGDAEARLRMGEASRELVAQHDIALTLEAFEGIYQESAGGAQSLPRTAHRDEHEDTAHSGR